MSVPKCCCIATLILGVLSLLGFGCSSSAAPPEAALPADQAHYDSPQAAVDSLVGALRKEDSAKLKEIFGPESNEILSSGDPVADRADGARFLAAYDESHRLQAEEGNQHILVVGKKDWPFPVPIVGAQGKYFFDTAAGEDEILNRRIGRNELDAVQVCLAVVDAQREYVALRPLGGDVPRYASKLVSSPGAKDGLYWPTVENEKPSPLGELVAEASAEGYGAAGGGGERAAGEPPQPYHGYRYRLLTSQGSHAQGGAMDYIVKGQLIGGFAVIGYPAQYGNSGIMSFITNHDGVVYQRDLGDDTEKIAQTITTFDPAPEWKPVTDAQQASAD